MRSLTVSIIAFALSLPVFAQDYNRGDWGAWQDYDIDCRDTRSETLQERSLVEVGYSSASRCYVSSGAWLGPFTGKVYTSASQVEIDHVIPLRYAHEYGGAQWPPLLKRAFANDPENLLVVQMSENRSKGWRGPSGYMPPNTTFHCEYARLWMHLIRKYELQAAGADRLVIAGVLGGC